MPRAIPAAATLAKNVLDSGKPLLELWRVDVGGGQFLNLVKHPRSIIYGAVTYQPYPVERAAEEQSGAGKIAQMVVQVSNVTREAQAYIEADANGLRGKTVERRLVDADTLTWDILDVYTITAVDCDDTLASFTLEKPIPAYELKYPMLVINRDDFPAVPE